MAQIGQPQRTIEVVPLHEPVPAPAAPEHEPVQQPEPEEVPTND